MTSLVRVIVVTLLVAAGPLSVESWAQSATSAPIDSRPGRLLEPGHWAVKSFERLVQAGRLDQSSTAQGAVPVDEVLLGFLQVAQGDGGQSEVGRRAAAWAARLEDEFPGILEGSGMALHEVQLSAGVASRQGGVVPGFGEFEPDRTGPVGLSDRESLLGNVVISGGNDHLFLAGDLAADADGVRLDRLEAGGSIGPMRAMVGRAPIKYGYANRGGVVSGGEVPIDAFQIATRRPVVLPTVLRVLGEVGFHGFVGRMDEERHPDRPLAWGASLAVQPHPRFNLAINRAAMFGGDSTEPVNLENVANMLIGRVVGIGFEDQIVSVSGRLRLPTESVVPLLAYIEWGAEDAAGGWFDVPGIVAGISAPELPFAPEAGAGLEYATFGESCCDNPEWYRHWSFFGGWASREDVLGYPLGGHGSQISGYLHSPFSDGRLQVDLELFRRDRGRENLFSPQRQGVSGGAVVGLGWQATSDWRIEADADVEWAEDWTDREFRLRISRFAL